MKFEELFLKGAFIIQLEKLQDERGFFARTFCQKEFQAHGLSQHVVQSNTSYNNIKGTLRGMHFQLEPHSEAKLVRCTRGSIYDVIIDLRPASETYLQWTGLELNEDNHTMLYIPEGFAHGFQTLADATEVSYQMYSSFVPEAARGIKWNDPAFQIEWPLNPTMISAKDQSYPDFQASNVLTI